MSISGRYLHTMLHVTDLQRSVDFYVKMLGMKELRRGKAEGRENVFVGYGAESATTVLELTARVNLPTLDHGTSFGHLAIGVADVTAACSWLGAQGVVVERPPTTLSSGLVIAFVRDPDGYAIELVQRP